MALLSMLGNLGNKPPMYKPNNATGNVGATTGMGNTGGMTYSADSGGNFSNPPAPASGSFNTGGFQAPRPQTNSYGGGGGMMGGFGLTRGLNAGNVARPTGGLGNGINRGFDQWFADNGLQTNPNMLNPDGSFNYKYAGSPEFFNSLTPEQRQSYVDNQWGRQLTSANQSIAPTRSLTDTFNGTPSSAPQQQEWAWGNDYFSHMGPQWAQQQIQRLQQSNADWQNWLGSATASGAPASPSGMAAYGNAANPQIAAQNKRIKELQDWLATQPK